MIAGFVKIIGPLSSLIFSKESISGFLLYLVKSISKRSLAGLFLSGLTTKVLPKRPPSVALISIISRSKVSFEAPIKVTQRSFIVNGFPLNSYLKVDLLL